MRGYLAVKTISRAWKPHPKAKTLVNQESLGQQTQAQTLSAALALMSTRHSSLNTVGQTVTSGSITELVIIFFNLHHHTKTLINKCFHSSRIYLHMDIYFICQGLDYLHFPVKMFELTQLGDDEQQDSYPDLSDPQSLLTFPMYLSFLLEAIFCVGGNGN